MFFLRMGERFLLNSFYRKDAKAQKVVFTVQVTKFSAGNALLPISNSLQRKEYLELALRSDNKHCRTF